MVGWGSLSRYWTFMACRAGEEEDKKSCDPIIKMHHRIRPALPAASGPIDEKRGRVRGPAVRPGHFWFGFRSDSGGAVGDSVCEWALVLTKVLGTETRTCLSARRSALRPYYLSLVAIFGYPVSCLCLGRRSGDKS